MALNDLITQINVAARFPTSRTPSPVNRHPKPRQLEPDYRQKLARSLDERSRRNDKVDDVRPRPTDGASNRSTSTADRDARSRFDRPAPAEKNPEANTTTSDVKNQEQSRSSETADKPNEGATTSGHSQVGSTEENGNDNNAVNGSSESAETDSTNEVDSSVIHIVTDTDLDIISTTSGDRDKAFLFNIQTDEAEASKSDPEQLTALADDVEVFVSTEVARTSDIPLGIQLLFKDIIEQAEPEAEPSVDGNNNDEPLVPPSGLLQVLDTSLQSVDSVPEVIFSIQTQSELPAEGQITEAPNIDFEAYTFSEATGTVGESSIAETPEIETSDDANRSIESRPFENLHLDVATRPDGIEPAQPALLPFEAAASNAPSPLPLPTDHGAAQFAVPESVAAGLSPASALNASQTTPAEVSSETIRTEPPAIEPIAVPITTGPLTTKPADGDLISSRATSSSGEPAELITGDISTTSDGINVSRQSNHETGVGKSINSLRTEVDQAEFADRLAGAIRQSHQSGRNLRMRLNPPELGVIQIEVSTKNGVLSARIEVQTSAAQRAILDNLSSLRDAISQNGTSIERVDVELGKNWSEDAESNFGSEDSREQDPEENERHQEHQETETQIDEGSEEQSQPRPFRINLDQLDIEV